MAVILPMLTLFTGELPIRSNVVTFALLYLSTNLLQRLAISALSRGLAPQGVAAVFEMIRMPVNLRATLTIFGGGNLEFKVTPKGGSRTAGLEFQPSS